MVLRAQRTEQAAKRLIKSQARRYVYQALSTQTDGAAYNTMVSLEDAILEEARHDWQEIHALWKSDFERLSLPPIVEKVALESYRECRHTFDEVHSRAIVLTALKEFFEKFDTRELIV